MKQEILKMVKVKEIYFIGYFQRLFEDFPATCINTHRRHNYGGVDEVMDMMEDEPIGSFKDLTGATIRNY